MEKNLDLIVESPSALARDQRQDKINALLDERDSIVNDPAKKDRLAQLERELLELSKPQTVQHDMKIEKDIDRQLSAAQARIDEGIEEARSSRPKSDPAWHPTVPYGEVKDMLEHLEQRASSVDFDNDQDQELINIRSRLRAVNEEITGLYREFEHDVLPKLPVNNRRLYIQSMNSIAHDIKEVWRDLTPDCTNVEIKQIVASLTTNLQKMKDLYMEAKKRLES